MTTRLTIKGAAAKTAGSRYLDILVYAAKGTGTYAMTEANFAGLGKYLPGFVHVGSGTPANVTLFIDDGTANRQIYGAGGGLVWADGAVADGTAGAVLLVIATGATDIYLFPMGD